MNKFVLFVFALVVAAPLAIACGGNSAAPSAPSNDSTAAPAGSSSAAPADSGPATRKRGSAAG